jgi:hypothetical protein
VVNNEISDNKKCRQISGKIGGHVDTAVQCGAHCLMKRTHGFMQSHKMPPLGKCLRRITLAAAMVDNVKKKKNTNKTQLLSFRTIDGQK